jgi:hypothetical protein
MSRHRFSTPTVVEIRDPRPLVMLRRTVDPPLDGPPDDWIAPPLTGCVAV